MQTLFSRLLAAASFVAAAAFAPVSLAQTSNFIELNPPQSTDAGDKTEVLEFFAYSCPHCNVLEPMVETWSKQLPANAILTRVPVAFNAGMKPQQQLYYTLEALGRLDLHPKVFAAIHKDRKRLVTKQNIVDWAADQGLDRAKFESTYDSFGVSSKAQRADQLTRNYRIEGTPSIAVGGRYVTSPSQAGGYRETITVADGLVKRLAGQ
ncbi:Periplasmic thiol:disulfide interchange protein DsbA [plant metagenome]|uniref:Thiol:disulfide interchange protein DsbA n=1 Tax=plant metagenome TaxID=1297885 RepID=A0A484UEK2_9ZZZZ